MRLRRQSRYDPAYFRRGVQSVGNWGIGLEGQRIGDLEVKGIWLQTASTTAAGCQNPV
jgi:hypothetical protein